MFFHNLKQLLSSLYLFVFVEGVPRVGKEDSQVFLSCEDTTLVLRLPERVFCNIFFVNRSAYLCCA
jgi:hypothetical protein